MNKTQGITDALCDAGAAFGRLHETIHNHLNNREAGMKQFSSAYDIDDAVYVALNNHNTQVLLCRVLGVHFKTGGVFYDLAILVRGGEMICHDVDSAFVLKDIPEE